MRRKALKFWPGIALLAAFNGCVGTDIINDSNLIVPARVEVTPAIMATQVDGVVQFNAVFYDTLGNLVQDVAFSWQSSDTGVASIDPLGEATAVGVGQVMITASANAVTSDPSLLTVVADVNQVAMVFLSTDTLALATGQTAQLTAEAQNLSGQPLSGKPTTWRSTNPDVATTDAEGLVTAVMPGRTEIIASVDGVESAPTVVIVLDGERTGTFERRPGTSYDVRGSAVLRLTESGRFKLSFGEDFRCSNGPGLHVMLSSTNRLNSQSIDLGRLISTSGQQEYDIPEGVTTSDFNWIIIHCVPFNVTFGYAELE